MATADDDDVRSWLQTPDRDPEVLGELRRAFVSGFGNGRSAIAEAVE
jgi:hypothetical protein